MRALGEDGKPPEGLFFPDTYLFGKGTRDIDLLRQSRDRMRRELATAWASRHENLPLKDDYEALILASIIERETGHPDERARIAGVFVERLRRGMRLQTDPTVIYGLGEKFDGNLRRADLERDGPYNTYTRARAAADADCASRGGFVAGGGATGRARRAFLRRDGRGRRQARVLEDAGGTRGRRAAVPGALPSTEQQGSLSNVQGRFITFEGGEGVGKSTQIRRAAALAGSGRRRGRADARARWHTAGPNSCAASCSSAPTSPCRNRANCC